MARFAEGPAIFAKGDVIRGGFRRLSPAVDVDEGVDVPVFQQLVGGDIVMCGIKADIYRGKAKAVAAKVIYGKKEIFTVMAFGIRKLQQEREFDLERAIPAAEHIEGMAEIPGIIATVPSPSGVRVRIMAAAVVAEGAGRLARCKMPAGRGSMGDQCSAIAGEGKGSGVNEVELEGREDGEEEKDPLEGSLRVFRSRAAIHNVADDVFGGNVGGVFRFCQLAVSANGLFRLFPIFVGREEERTGIVVPCAQPETVHKVIVRAKRGKVVQGRAADEECQGNRAWEDFSNP